MTLSAFFTTPTVTTTPKPLEWPKPVGPFEFEGIDPPVNTTTFAPTYDGSNVTVHPSILHVNARVPEYDGPPLWVMVDTPYPNYQDPLENPSIWVSRDRITWEVPAGVTNPIYPWQGEGWNSDPEMVYDPDIQRFVAVWRDYSRTKMDFHAAVSRDANTWRLLPEPLLPNVQKPWLAPAIHRESDGTWRMWLWGEFENPRILKAPSSLGPWEHETTCVLNWPDSIPEADRVNWHGDVLIVDGIYVGVFSGKDRATTNFIASRDGVTWNVSEFVPRETGWYGYRSTLEHSTVQGHLDMWTSRMNERNVYHRVPIAEWTKLL